MVNKKTLDKALQNYSKAWCVFVAAKQAYELARHSYEEIRRAYVLANDFKEDEK